MSEGLIRICGVLFRGGYGGGFDWAIILRFGDFSYFTCYGLFFILTVNFKSISKNAQLLVKLQSIFIIFLNPFFAHQPLSLPKSIRSYHIRTVFLPF